MTLLLLSFFFIEEEIVSSLSLLGTFENIPFFGVVCETVMPFIDKDFKLWFGSEYLVTFYWLERLFLI